jgi:phospholipase A1
MQKYATGDDSLTLADIRESCGHTKVTEEEVKIAALSIGPNATKPRGAISNRINKERETEFQPCVITPHRINYILPVMSTNAINKGAYSSFDGYEDNLEDIEAKFKVSLKIPLNNNSMFVEGDGLYLFHRCTYVAWSYCNNP